MENELLNFKVRTPIPVRYSDLDTMGHVNNATYLSYMEEGRVDYARRVFGMEKNSVEFQMVVARIEIDYKKSVYFGDSVVVCTRTGRIGSKSFTVEQIIEGERGGKEYIAARAVTTLVCFDAKEGVSMEIPEVMRKQMGFFENEIPESG